MPIAVQKHRVNVAIEKTIATARVSPMQATVGDEATAAALGKGSEEAAEAVPRLQEQQGYAPAAAVAAVQGWRLADLLRGVDLGGALAEGLLLLQPLDLTDTSPVLVQCLRGVVLELRRRASVRGTQRADADASLMPLLLTNFLEPLVEGESIVQFHRYAVPPSRGSAP